jgi:hypothetical protein
MLLRPIRVASLCLHRHFSTSISKNAPRFYRYAVDVHGQLFLHDTTPKNLTSCFKNAQFLDFFYARIKPNTLESSGEEGEGQIEQDQKTIQDPEWTEKSDLSRDDAIRLAVLDGYEWVSPCQGELNFIRAAKSPIVFRELDEQGEILPLFTYRAMAADMLSSLI